MNFIQQKADRDCGICVAAMLADVSYEQVLQFFPDHETPTHEIRNCLLFFGWKSEPAPRRLGLYRGYRYFCTIGLCGENDPRRTHAIAVDENGVVFDPTTAVSAPGQRPFDWYTQAPNELHDFFRVCRTLT